MIQIWQHLGLGDHILCNGLIRTIINPTQDYEMFVKRAYEKSVSYMFRDLKNISYVGTDTIEEALQNRSRAGDPPLIQIGYGMLPNVPFDQFFYIQHKVPYEYRWSKFYVERDSVREREFFDKFNVKPREYVFIFDDDRYKIDLDKVENNHLPIVKCDYGVTENIFDYLLLAQEALSCHMIESSLLFAVEQMNLNNEIFVHRYARYQDHYSTPIYKNVKCIL